MNKFWLNFSFFLLLLLLPNQLGLHLWPKWTIVQGLRIDYLSPTLYLTYLLIVAFLSSTAIPYRPKSFGSIFSPFLLLLLFTITNSSPASLLKMDQLLVLIALGVAITKVATRITWAWLGLPLALIWTSLLAVYQAFSQHSSVFWVLGERFFSISTPGIARFSLFGTDFLRPYATFSHPNSLAGFLLVGLFLTLGFRQRFPRWFTLTAITSSTIGIAISGSRAAILTGIFLLLLTILKKFLSEKLTFWFPLFIFALILTITITITPSSSDQSLVRRTEEIKFALSAWGTNPIFGVGLNNVIPVLGKTLPSSQYPNLSSPVLWLQPVHNVFILALVETGLVGLSTLVYFLIKTLVILNHKSYFLYLSFLGILFTSLADHYWFTLLQNQLLATLVLGLIWAKHSRG